MKRLLDRQLHTDVCARRTRTPPRALSQLVGDPRRAAVRGCQMAHEIFEEATACILSKEQLPTEHKACKLHSSTRQAIALALNCLKVS
eukprot:5149737-Pleurochrysis_carterae.AAC.1